MATWAEASAVRSVNRVNISRRRLHTAQTGGDGNNTQTPEEASGKKNKCRWGKNKVMKMGISSQLASWAELSDHNLCRLKHNQSLKQGKKLL